MQKYFMKWLKKWRSWRLKISNSGKMRLNMKSKGMNPLFKRENKNHKFRN